MTLAMARSRGMLPLCCLGLGLWSFLAWDADFLVPRPAFPGAAEAGLSRASGAPRRAFPLEKLVSAKKRKRLASLGTSSVLSYLLLKFLKHSIINAVAWYLTAKRLGVSPLQKWPTFLATYAAVYVASTPLQPAKWAVIVAMSPVLDRTMEKISARMGWSKQTTAGAILLGISALGAIVWMLGVLVAGSLARVSIW
ncbi:hypothetical protein AK812_SmicGene26237 [Symbiodinium microadriaticum]|uniref:Uncharacterized protein n=1 Tax=Symbiodinium microadriaticum TaxID=2951 RepID=A0A1Q9DA55_SYMMI|nr:hypothetical protein AK812_SmicGene26237 [Symbiodinium microadriaticum]